MHTARLPFVSGKVRLHRRTSDLPEASGRELALRMFGVPRPRARGANASAMVDPTQA